MRFFYIFLTISATLTVSAVPLPVASDHSTTANSNASARSSPYGRPPRRPGRPTSEEKLARPIQDPKITFQYGSVPLHDQDNTKTEILEDFHIFSALSPGLAKRTKLAHVSTDWVYLHDRQCLEVRYYQGLRTSTRDVDVGVRKIYRDLPPSRPLVLSLNHNIPLEEKDELTDLVTKYYNALPANSPYRRAHITRVERGWHPGGGNIDEARDHLLFTSHKSTTHTDNNIIGEPHIIRRPLTVSVDGEMGPVLRNHIEHKVREHHKCIMDPTDAAKLSDVALVDGGPYRNADGKYEVQAGFYKWPDRPNSDELIVDYGQRPVSLH